MSKEGSKREGGPPSLFSSVNWRRSKLIQRTRSSCYQSDTRGRQRASETDDGRWAGGRTDMRQNRTEVREKKDEAAGLTDSSYSHRTFLFGEHFHE